MDGKTNRRNKAAFSNFSSEVCTQPCFLWDQREACSVSYLRSQLSRLTVLTPVQVIRAVMINEISCDKGNISSNDNKRYRYDRRDFSVFKALSSPTYTLPRGVLPKFAVYSQNGCDGLTKGKHKPEGKKTV